MYKAVRCVTINSKKFQRYIEASLRLFRRRIARKIIRHSVLSSVSKHIVIILSAGIRHLDIKYELFVKATDAYVYNNSDNFIEIIYNNLFL